MKVWTNLQKQKILLLIYNLTCWMDSRYEYIFKNLFMHFLTILSKPNDLL